MQRVHIIRFIIFVLFLLFALAVPALAQDATLQATPVVTAVETPAPVVAAQPPVVVNVEPQQPAAEPTQPDAQARLETALIGALFIANFALMFFAGAFVVFARHLKESTPSWVADILKEYIPKAIEAGTIAVESTTTPVDNDLWEAVRPKLQQFLVEAGLMTAPDTPNG